MGGYRIVIRTEKRQAEKKSFSVRKSRIPDLRIFYKSFGFG